MRIETFLLQSPVFQANRLAKRMDAALGEALRGDGLAVFEAMLLVAVFFEGRGGVKPSELAEVFQTTRGNVSHCISSLEAKGLVERRIDAEDARGVQLVLRSAGKKKAARVAGILDLMQRRLEEVEGVDRLEKMLGQLGRVAALCDEFAGTRKGS